MPLKLRLTITALLGLLSACSGEARGAPSEPQIHRLARTAIEAWAEVDFAKLASICRASSKEDIEEMLSDPERLAEARKRFTRNDGPKGPTYQRTKDWDGKILGVRYRHFVGTARDEYVANVWFSTLGKDELLVASFVLEGDEWRFDDMHSPTKSMWLEGREEFAETSDSY